MSNNYGFDDWIKSRDYICPICEQGKMTHKDTYCPLGTYFKKDIGMKCQEWKCDHCHDSILDDLSSYVTDKAFIALREFMERK